MLKKYLFFLTLFFFVGVLFSCSNDENYEPNPNEEENSAVVFDIENVPYQTLSEYIFFDGTLSSLTPISGVFLTI